MDLGDLVRFSELGDDGLDGAVFFGELDLGVAFFFSETREPPVEGFISTIRLSPKGYPQPSYPFDSCSDIKSIYDT